MAQEKKKYEAIDPGRLLTGYGAGQSRLRLPPGQAIYAQGDRSDAAFYVESGLVKIGVLVASGKEAVIGIRRQGEFFGTRCLVAQRLGSATTLSACSLIRVTTPALTRLLREEPDFAVMFATELVRQSIDDQSTLVAQLTSSAEQRLARTLLRLADFSHGKDPAPTPAGINQTVLAEMVGTTRSRVNYFMNKFRREGLIEYNRAGDIRVRHALRHALFGEQPDR